MASNTQALSREELLKYVENQSEQVSRYELRFRDVVKAYRSQTKEKEVLEASLKALSRSKGPSRPIGTPKTPRTPGKRSKLGQPENRSETESDTQSEIKDQPSDLATLSVSLSSDSEGESKDASLKDQEGEEEEDFETLREQLSTLTDSLASLTEQKTLMEASFQADKKKMMGEHETAFEVLRKTSSEKDSEMLALREQLGEVMRSFKQEQMDRQLNEESHGEVVRELQKMLSTERTAKDSLEKELKRKEDELKSQQLWIQDQLSKGYKEQFETLSKELQETRAARDSLRSQSSRPHPAVVHLQEEIRQMKAHHNEAFRVEQRRANDAEERLYIQSQSEEQRVSSLERRLTELSEIVGNYDRQKDEGQIVNLKLKERISQLDLENTNLTRAHIERQENRQIDEEMTTLREQITKLKALLRIAGQKLSDRDAFGLEESQSLTEYSAFLSSQPSKKDYQDEISHLKEEFERYKTRAHNVLRSKGKEPDVQSSKELQEVSEKNELLESDIIAQKKLYEEESEKILKQNAELREEMRSLHRQHQSQLNEQDAANKQLLQDTHQKAQKTRERTFTLLKEKDEEIERLKKELADLAANPNSPSHFTGALPLRRPSARATSVESSSGDIKTPSTPVDQLFEQSPSSTGGSQSLHRMEEQARKDRDLGAAKKAKVALEQTVGDLREREVMLLDQATFLKQEIRKLERDRTRETSNMEYIKNVILHYMCTNSTGREQMTAAIATALHFSEGELTKAQEKYSKSWTGW